MCNWNFSLLRIYALFHKKEGASGTKQTIVTTIIDSVQITTRVGQEVFELDIQELLKSEWETTNALTQKCN